MPQIQQRDEQRYLAIRSEVTNGIAAVVDHTFPQLFAWLGRHGVEPAGPAARNRATTPSAPTSSPPAATRP